MNKLQEKEINWEWYNRRGDRQTDRQTERVKEEGGIKNVNLKKKKDWF